MPFSILMNLDEVKLIWVSTQQYANYYRNSQTVYMRLTVTPLELHCQWLALAARFFIVCIQASNCLCVPCYYVCEYFK